jgi:hypothetical protein
MLIAFIFATAFVSGCKNDTPPQSSSTACSKDSDCKGDRVCDNGKCVDPTKPTGGGGGPLAAKGSSPAATDARMAAKKEALEMLARIEKASSDQFALDVDLGGTGTGPFGHRFCPANSGKNGWADASWRCLRFAPKANLLCSYAYEADGHDGAAIFTATANCDPDHDGNNLRATLKGKGDASGKTARVSLTVEGDGGT